MISVIITTKDRVEFLNRAVRSVMNSSTLPLDVIIVNDGGVKIRDDTFRFNNDVKIKIINNEISLGGNKARNQGAEKAEGEYLFFLDDDDAYTVDSISSRLPYFDDPNTGLVYTGKKFVKSDRLEKVYHVSKPHYEGMLLKHLFKLGNIIGTTSCVAVRREAFNDAGGFDTELHALQDYDLWIRVASQYQVRHDNACNVLYTVHVNSKQISSNYYKYLEAGDFLHHKYKVQLKGFKLEREFLAARYLRVAMVASKFSSLARVKYSLLSFIYKPSLKSLFLLIPVTVSKKIRNFH
ncbi:TPA: glycosyltransferase family 2 protein [Vibrio parahaemolyticus]